MTTTTEPVVVRNGKRYEKGQRDALEAIKAHGGEQTSALYARYFAASDDDYAQGYAEVVWQWRYSQHPSSGFGGRF